MPKPPLLPVAEDVSPDLNTGTGGDPATAGLTLQLAGDPDALYAVSCNAGVWKTASNLPLSLIHI